MLPVLPIALQLAQLVGPKIVKMVAGDSAGKVAEQVIATAQSISGEETPETALSTLSANPTLRVQYMQAVLDQETELEKAYLGDRQDARQRDVQLRMAGYQNKRADLMVFTAFVSLVVIVACIWNLSEGIPGEVLGFMSTAAGALLKMLSDAFQFEFGSSRGSKEKDQRLQGAQ